MLAKNAVQKLDIVNPLTIDETSINTNALMTSRNSPIVKTVSGSVNRISKGLTIAFAKPSSRAAITREEVSVKRRPVNT